jgi:hypothetical protein
MTDVLLLLRVLALKGYAYAYGTVIKIEEYEMFIIGVSQDKALLHFYLRS